MLDAGIWGYRSTGENSGAEELSVATAVTWYHTMFRREPGSYRELYNSRSIQLILRRIFIYTAHLCIGRDDGVEMNNPYRPFCREFYEGVPLKFRLGSVEPAVLLKLISDGLYRSDTEDKFSILSSCRTFRKFSITKKTRIFSRFTGGGETLKTELALCENPPGLSVKPRGGSLYFCIKKEAEGNELICWYDGFQFREPEYILQVSADSDSIADLMGLELSRFLSGEPEEIEVVKRVLVSVNNDERYNSLNSLRARDYYRAGRTILKG